MSSSVVTSPTRSNQASSGASRRVGNKRWLYQKSAAAFRWVHIYVSMLSFASLMFFAFTGITLNHPTWLGGSEQVIRDESGELPEHLKKALNVEPLDKLGIAEWLRAEHRLKGYVAEFTDDDEFELMIVYKGPGYSADVFVTRDTGEYMLTKSESN
ncbi:MAG: PepSY-associated TM helix domain-containing protein, partial [Planctomycetota bacterium]